MVKPWHVLVFLVCVGLPLALITVGAVFAVRRRKS